MIGLAQRHSAEGILNHCLVSQIYLRLSSGFTKLKFHILLKEANGEEVIAKLQSEQSKNQKTHNSL